MVLGTSTLACVCIKLVLALSRVMQPGNPKICGEVPLTLRGIVAKFVNDTTNQVEEVKTLGVCNNGAAARPGTTPEPVLGPVPSARPEPATNREPAPAPTASPGSSASEPSAKLGQASDMMEPAGPADRVQVAPLMAPAVPTMDVPPNIAQEPVLVAESPAAPRTSVPIPTRNPSSSMVRLAIPTHVVYLYR